MAKKNSSYNQIIKSTSIFGGSQIINIILGFVRNKIVAILLGTAGVGLIGIYQSIVDMIRSVAGMGMDTGGIREIAAANGMEDKRGVNEMIAVIRWWIIVTACLGALVCLFFCYPISIWAFETPIYTLPIALLSVCIFFTMMNIGQNIIIQGMRDIPRLVKASIISNFSSLIISIPIYYLLGLKGIALSLVLGSLVSFIITFIYYRQLGIVKVHVPFRIAIKKGSRMLRLGFFIVLAGAVGTGSMFLIRTFLGRNLDLEAAGLFQAVFTITNVYLALILRSMGSDFYPRLCSIINIKAAARKLVNEQTYIVLVVSAPIVVGMILLSKVVLSALYSSEFTAATSLLQWQVVGTLLKVLSWPMGFVLLAKAKGSWHLFAEVLFYAVYLLGIYILLPFYTLEAVGISYLIAYIVYLLTVYIMTAKLNNFRWTSEVIYMALTSFILVIITFVVMQTLPTIPAYFIASVLFIAVLTYSLYKLNRVMDIKSIVNKIRKR